jgi:hypothetical protein
MKRERMTLTHAKGRYPHRFTLEHVPQWASEPASNGMFYAPQYRSDQEWYDNTLFPPHNPYHRKHCHSENQSWPLGQWLIHPYKQAKEN